MRCEIVIALLACVAFVGTSSIDSIDIVNKIIQLVVMYVEIIVQRMGDINVISSKTTIYMEKFRIPDLSGTFALEALTLYGLGSIIIHKDSITGDISLIKRNDGKVDMVFSISVNVSLPSKTGIKISGYDADIGIMQEIPLFGKGDIVLEIRKIDAHFRAKLNLTSPFHLEELELRSTFRHSLVQITGFWNNDDVSNILSYALTTIERLIAMFWDYEADCITYVISDAIKSLINGLLNNNKSQINWNLHMCKETCLGSDNTLLSAIFNKTVSRYLKSISQGDIDNYILIADDFVNEYQNQFS